MICVRTAGTGNRKTRMDINKLKISISLWQIHFPVFIIAQEEIYSANTRKTLLSKLVKLSVHNEKIQVINFMGRTSCFNREKSLFFPELLKKTRTKKQIIEIYNSSFNAQKTKYSLKSLSNKKKCDVFDDIYHLVRETENLI